VELSCESSRTLITCAFDVAYASSPRHTTCHPTNKGTIQIDNPQKKKKKQGCTAYQ
jgi:hypothetical protein